MFCVFISLENTFFRTASSLQKTAYRLTNANQFEHYKPKNQTFADSQQLSEIANTPYTDTKKKHVQGNISPHVQIKCEYYNYAPLYSHGTSAPALLQNLRSSTHWPHQMKKQCCLQPLILKILILQTQTQQFGYFKNITFKNTVCIETLGKHKQPRILEDPQQICDLSQVP